MKTPHKHSELIKLWADGELIETKTGDGWYVTFTPTWHSDQDFRVYKPKSLSLFYRVNKCDMNSDTPYPEVKWNSIKNGSNLELVFCEETGELINCLIVKK